MGKHTNRKSVRKNTPNRPKKIPRRPTGTRDGTVPIFTTTGGVKVCNLSVITARIENPPGEARGTTRLTQPRAPGPGASSFYFSFPNYFLPLRRSTWMLVDPHAASLRGRRIRKGGALCRRPRKNYRGRTQVEVRNKSRVCRTNLGRSAT